VHALQNPLINYAITQDWMVDTNLYLNEEEESNNPSDAGKRHNQILGYKLEMR